MRPNQVPTNRRITRQQRQQQQSQSKKSSQHTSKLFNPGLDSLRDHPSETNLSQFASGIKNNSTPKTRHLKAKLDDELLQLMEQRLSGQSSSSVESDSYQDMLATDRNLQGASASHTMANLMLQSERQKTSTSFINTKVVLSNVKEPSQLDPFSSPQKQAGLSRPDLGSSSRNAQKRLRSNSSRNTVVLPFCSPQIPEKLQPLAAAGEATQSRKGVSLSFCEGKQTQQNKTQTHELQRHQKANKIQGNGETKNQARVTRQAVRSQLQGQRSATRQANARDGESDLEMRYDQQQRQTQAQLQEEESLIIDARSSFLRGVVNLRLESDMQRSPSDQRFLDHKIAMDYLKYKASRKHLIQASADDLLKSNLEYLQQSQAYEGQANLQNQSNPPQDFNANLAINTQQQEQLLLQQQQQQQQQSLLSAEEALLSQTLTREQFNGYENIKELILIGKHTLQVQQDVLQVIDHICFLVNHQPVALLPILEQDNISLFDLNSVKNYLIQQHQEQSQLIYRNSQQIELLAESLANQDKSQILTAATLLEPIQDIERQQRHTESLQSYNALLQMTKQFTDLLASLTEACPELVQLMNAVNNQKIPDFEAAQQQANNENNGMVGGDLDQQQQLALQAESELLNQAYLKERLQELVTDPNNFALGTDINDPETLLKIRDLRSVLEQLVLQQENPQPGQDNVTIENQIMTLQARVEEAQRADKQMAGQEEIKLTNENLNQAADLLQQRDEIEAILQLKQQLNFYLGNAQNVPQGGEGIENATPLGDPAVKETNLTALLQSATQPQPNQPQQNQQQPQLQQQQQQSDEQQTDQHQTLEVVHQLTQLLQLQIQQEQKAGADPTKPGPDAAVDPDTQAMLQELAGIIQNATSEQQMLENQQAQKNINHANPSQSKNPEDDLAQERAQQQSVAMQNGESIAQEQPGGQVPQQLTEEQDQGNKLHLILEMLQPYAQDASIKERIDQFEHLQGVLKDGTPDQKVQAQGQIIQYIESLQNLDLNSVLASQSNTQQQQQPQQQQQQVMVPQQDQLLSQQQAAQILQQAKSNEQMILLQDFQKTQEDLQRLQFQHDQVNANKAANTNAAAGDSQQQQNTKTIDEEQQERELQIVTLQCQAQMLYQLINQYQVDDLNQNQQQQQQQQQNVQGLDPMQAAAQQKNDYLLQMQLQMLLNQQQNPGQAGIPADQLLQAIGGLQNQQNQQNSTAVVQQQSQPLLDQQNQQNQQLNPNPAQDAIAPPSSLLIHQQLTDPNNPAVIRPPTPNATNPATSMISQPAQAQQQLQQMQNQPQPKQQQSEQLAQFAESYQAHLDELQERLAFAQLTQAQQSQLQNEQRNQMKQQSIDTATAANGNNQQPQLQQTQQSLQQQDTATAQQLLQQQQNKPQLINTTSQVANTGINANKNATESLLQPQTIEDLSQQQQQNAANLQQQAVSQNQQPQITEEQRLQIIQKLSLNIQEQEQMKEALQDAKGIQELYKSNPHQLIEMLQHLQQLESMAEQMQSIIQPLSQQQTTSIQQQAAEVLGNEDKDMKNDGVTQGVATGEGVNNESLINDELTKKAAEQAAQQNQAANILEQQMQQLQNQVNQQSQPAGVNISQTTQLQQQQTNAVSQPQLVHTQSAPSFQKPTIDQLPVFLDQQQAFISQTPTQLNQQQAQMLQQQQQQMIQTPTGQNAAANGGQFQHQLSGADKQHQQQVQQYGAVSQTQQQQQILGANGMVQTPQGAMVQQQAQQQGLNRRCQNHLFVAHMIKHHQGASGQGPEGAAAYNVPQQTQVISNLAPGVANANMVGATTIDPAALAAAQQQQAVLESSQNHLQQFSQQQQLQMAIDQQNQQMLQLQQQMDSQKKQNSSGQQA